MQCSVRPSSSRCVQQSRTGCRGHAHQQPGSNKEGKEEKDEHEIRRKNWSRRPQQPTEPRLIFLTDEAKNHKPIHQFLLPQ